METRSLSMKGALVAGLLALFFYLSGFWILPNWFFTPLPILYAFRKGGTGKGMVALGWGLVFLAILYAGLLPLAVEKGAPKLFEIFLWLPGMAPASGAIPENLWAVMVGNFAFLAILGALLGEFESRGYSVSRLVAQTLALEALFFLLWLAWFYGGDLKALAGEIESYFVEALTAVAKLPQPNEELQAYVTFIGRRSQRIAYYAARLLPAFFINGTIFVIWLNIVVCKTVFYRDGFFAGLGPLGRWRLPFSFIWVAIGFAFGLLMDIYFFKSGSLKLIAINAFIVFAMIYFLQGLAILAFFTVRWALSPLTRIFLYLLLVLFFQFVSIFLVVIGFFDSWFDFRRLTGKATSPLPPP